MNKVKSHDWFKEEKIRDEEVEAFYLNLKRKEKE
jgi:hypothetical protein